MEKVMSGLVYTVKFLLFYPLMFLRGPFLLVADFAAGLLFLTSIVLWFLGIPHKAIFITFVTAFLIFILKQLYDLILLKLNPHNTQLTLHQ